MLSCGESSGDLYAGALAAELRAQAPDVEVFGFGGPRLRAAGGRLIGDFAGLSVTGLTEALRVIPRSFAMLRRLEEAARETRPDVFVAIDFPDFNFRLMAAMRRLGIPIVYYISPQLWAWRAGRMRTMQRFVDRVLVIFPFEEAIYRDAGVPVTFVGHPLVELARAGQPRDEFQLAHGLTPGKPTIALLPGSRPNELHRIVPTMAAALPMIAARVRDAQFVIAAAPSLDGALFAPLQHALRSSTNGDERAPGATPGNRITLIRERADEVLATSDVAITASGTATVQAALHECPMVVVYRLSPMTYAIGKPFVRVDTYAMPNLIAGERVVPELIQEGFTAERVADEAVSLLQDQARRARVVEGLRRVRERLGAPGASRRAAEIIMRIARERVADPSA
jgi:lipid-A-disaccharide synthase